MTRFVLVALTLAWAAGCVLYAAFPGWPRGVFGWLFLAGAAVWFLAGVTLQELRSPLGIILWWLATITAWWLAGDAFMALL